MAPPPPPSRILDNLKQVHLNRVSWDRSTTAKAEPYIDPLRLVSPTRSRFASEDRIGEATFYPAGSPTPRMSRRSESSSEGRRHYRTDQRIVDEPESYADPQPVVVAGPVKKKSKWKQIFSRKGKKKGKASTHIEPPSPSLHSTQTNPFGEPLVIPPPLHGVPASDISTSRRYELRDPGFSPRRMSTAQSRAESLRASADARQGSALGASALGHQRQTAEGSVVSKREHYSYQSGSVLDPGPPVMLVDEQTGNRVPREDSYMSNRTGSYRMSGSGVPGKKKKRSFGGTLKRLFSRKKKVPPPVVQSTEPPVHTSHFVEMEESHPLPPVPPVPRRTQTPSSRSSAVPPVVAPIMSPRSSHSARERTADVVIPVSPRAATPVAAPFPTRRATGSTVVSVSRPPHRQGTGSSVGAAPQRYNTGSSFGLGRQGTGSSYGARTGTRPTPAPAPVLSQVSGSESPSIRSVTGDQSWGEIRVPAEPARVPVLAPAPTTRTGLGLGFGRTGLGLGLGPRPAPTTRAPARRTYTAPPARTPYVHVPRPIPPPPRYPTLPTRTTITTATGVDAQVQLIVTALRDLAEDDRHRRAVTEARLEEERAWTAAEREREAELRQLVLRLATSRGGGGLGAGIGEFGTREVRTESVEETTTTGFGGGRFGATVMPGSTGLGTTGLGTARLAGLGVGGADIERLLEIMRQGHEVTMQTYRDLIERWRKDIDFKHQEFLAEQQAIRARRERKREQPIHWQPGVNMW